MAKEREKVIGYAQAERAVEEIAAIGSSDDEAAHGREDDLYEKVLRSIAADGVSDPRKLARIALKTKGLEFQRHCG